MLVNLLERVHDVVHVPAGAEQQVVAEPETLLAANEVAVGAARMAVIQRGGGVGQVRAERLLPKDRLMRKREAVAGGDGDAFRLERPEHRLPRSAERGRVDPQ